MKKTCCSFLLLGSLITSAFAQGTAFTYQGRLNDAGNPATGIYDLRFTIYDALTGGTALGGPVTNSPVGVTNGLFMVVLDFGAGPFDGRGRWIEIDVRPNGSASDFATLVPRQPISPTPYAIFAGTASTVPNGAITSGKLASGAAAANLQASGQSAVAGGGIVLSEQANAMELLNAGYIKLGRADLVQESWLARANGPPGFGQAALARSGHSALWTGTEMIIWGGFDGAYRNNGARYNPASNTWTPMSTSNAPAPRAWHSAVWTGTEMIVHGGIAVGGFFGGTTITNTGGRYNPATDTWLSITNGGGSRRNHAAFWTGSRLLVWGGSVIITGTFGPTEVPNNSGALYDPGSDGWTFIPASGLNERLGFSAVWTGTEMIIWGGYDVSGTFISTRTNFNDGARYNPISNVWNPVNTAGAPFRRESHSAVWSGTEMIVWGGVYSEGFGVGLTNFNNGARYNPVGNSWSALATTAATPSARYDHTAAWVGNRMVIWGGTDGTNVFNSGARYFPSFNTWSNMTVTGRPTAREGHKHVVTSTEMMIWGGQDTNDLFLDIGGRYNPTTDIWQTMARTGERSTRRGHTAVWTGTELLIWGGFDGESYINGGGRFNPALNSWTPMNTTNAPTGRIGHTAVWTGTEMIIWGGTNTALLNSGARYNPASDTWSNTATASAPTARIGHSAVWSGSQMIVWGGYDGAFRSNGARYNPVGNSWSAMTTTAAPAVRADHVAVWTGTDMLVWGGRGGGGISPIALASGGRYNSLANTWSALPTAGAPAARAGHTGVWTGDELLVWGGTDLNTNLNSGGRYHMVSNSWRSITTDNAPSPREEHTAVWAGTRMIVWGGLSGGIYERTGGNYDPLTGVWISTQTNTNAPQARSQHVAAWTGTEMIIHGGSDGAFQLDDTHAYAPPRTMYLYLKP